jgi:ParB family transcriptional regulator, chromosome partitioning protein
MSDDPVVRISVPRAESTAKRPALGRGLGALLGETRREEPLVTPSQSSTGKVEPTSGMAMLRIADIEPHPAQPRRRFEEAALAELAASIAARGVIQPIIVTPHGAGRWRLVAGERRWRAAQRAQLHEIPAIIRDLDDREITALALIENLQREDLNPIEEARAYHPGRE